MGTKSNHVIPSKLNGGWDVRKAGSTERASRRFGNKSEAIEYARELSRKEHAELYIHRRDGSVQKRFYYGTDGDHFPPEVRAS